MTIVDPFLVPIPKDFLQRKDHREFFERLIRTIDQLRQRTGGATDEVAENNTRESYPWVLDGHTKEDVYLNHESSSEEVHYNYESVERGFNGVTASTNYTAIPWDWVRAKNNSIITFPMYPEDGAELIVTNGDGSDISLIGNGKKINGSNTGKIRKKYTSILFKYFLEDDEWLAT